jgi:hypothetical protein
MASLAVQTPAYQWMTMLSRLLLAPQAGGDSAPSSLEQPEPKLESITREEFDELLKLASSNHVVVRGMEVFLRLMLKAKDDARAEWAQTAIETEKARIGTALSYLEEICAAFRFEEFQIVVIKSLDHWPDFGSDIDLYTDADPAQISRLMMRRFSGRMAPRSWGDRLARKWNFLIPGLSEAVEVHVGRLGQTGEHVEFASRLSERTRRLMFGNREFRVPSASDRLMISTLQRMYRHFYFRLCDIVDTAALLQSGEIDFRDLRSAATEAGIWEGVATYLAIVSDYVRVYNGFGLDLPQFVFAAARFGGDRVYYEREFLRVPISPSAKLYGSQLVDLLRKWDLQNCFRLSLLPWLATAALVGQRITGSDKGIW